MSGPGALELIADDPSLRYARPGRCLLQPLGKILCKTHCDCLTHMSELYLFLSFRSSSAIPRPI